ncbi:MAG: restriction endonuclease subunit S [Gammaproteobacteria bacterium]|nr:restriction endonuclease subunit S [Gammaproteobacteria bacterium]
MWTRRGVPAPGDLVMAREAPVGNVGLILQGQRVCLGQRTVLIRVTSGDLDPVFMAYLLSSPALRAYMILLSNGATVGHLNVTDIRKLSLPSLPLLPVQRKVAAILTAYDDLIETNKRRIALFEKMAEELYREWFVRMRFPGHQDTKFVKSVPEGWEVRPISSFCEEIRAGVKKKDLADDEIYIGLEHIPRKSIAFKEWATADSIDSNKLRFKERDILFSKIRPYLHKVALAHFSGACSSDTIVLRPCDQIYEGFLLFTVFSDTFIELATVAAKGTKMPRADWAFLEKLELKIPPSELLEDYQSRFEEIFALIATLLKANQQATETRNLLLPRLISGKLSVEDLDIQFPPSMREEATEPAHA